VANGPVLLWWVPAPLVLPEGRPHAIPATHGARAATRHTRVGSPSDAWFPSAGRLTYESPIAT
jgi:hypothetical protein